MSAALPVVFSLVLPADAVPPADAARAAAESMCAEDARCEGMDCYYRARCSSVGDAPFAVGKNVPTLVLHAERRSDGEGNIERDRYYRWAGGELELLFEVESDSGGDGPHTSVDSTLVVCRARSKGVPELDVRVSRTVVEAPTGPEADWTSTRSVSVEHLTWDGKRFQRMPADRPCAEPVKPPPWFGSASASSTLAEKSLPKDFYQPSQAADTLPETAWAEGVAGTGTGEWLELRLARPMVIRTVRLLAGCGVNEKLWKSNERLKTLRLVFSDGEAQEASLQDSTFGKFAEIAVKRDQPTASLRIVVGEVYEAKYEDACLSEVELTGR